MSCGYLTAEDDDTFNFACVFLLYFVIFLHLLLKLGPMSGFCESLHSSMLLFSFNEPQLAMRAQKTPSECAHCGAWHLPFHGARRRKGGLQFVDLPHAQ